MLSFINEVKKNNSVIKLDDKFSSVDVNNTFKGVLYHYQKISLAAMLEIEQLQLDKNYLINKGILSIPVGMGKTIITLALLCNKPLINKSDILINVKNKYFKKKVKNNLQTNLVIVGSAIFIQWVKAINDFTNLKVLLVKNMKDFRVLLYHIENKTINNFDMVLLRCATISSKIKTPFNLPKGYYFDDQLPKDNSIIKKTIPKKGSYNMLYILSLFSNYSWNRVIYDDFDSLNFPSKIYNLNSIFTWYISSTKNSKRRIYNSNSDNIEYQRLILLNKLYNYPFDINFTKEYLSICSEMPKINSYLLTTKNSNGNMLNILNGVNSEISEMLNADAIETAAEAIGIKTNSVVDIFKKVLGSTFEKYRFAGDVVSFIEYCNEELPNLPSLPEDIDINDLSIDEDGNSYKTYKYGKKDVVKFREVEYKYLNIKNTLRESLEEYESIKDNTGKSVQRIKDNIKTGLCPICLVDLKDINKCIINSCCQIVLCDLCGIEKQNLHTKLAHCANCRKKITLKDLIYVSDEVKFEDITDEVFDEDEKQPVVVENSNINDKYTKLIDIIKSNDIEKKQIDIHYNNVQVGKKYLPESKIKKVLVFANYDETINKIIETLNKEKLNYVKLQGRSDQIHVDVENFNKSKVNSILIIKSTEYCNGLNIQTATDLVFMHKIINKDIESQVVGRAQRLGRTTTLNVWYNLYNNEKLYV